MVQKFKINDIVVFNEIHRASNAPLNFYKIEKYINDNIILKIDSKGHPEIASGALEQNIQHPTESEMAEYIARKLKGYDWDSRNT